MYNIHSLLLPVTSKTNQLVISKYCNNLGIVMLLIKLHHAVVKTEFWCPVSAVLLLTHFVFATVVQPMVSLSSWMWTEAHKHMQNGSSGEKAIPEGKGIKGGFHTNGCFYWGYSFSLNSRLILKAIRVRILNLNYVVIHGLILCLFIIFFVLWLLNRAFKNRMDGNKRMLLYPLLQPDSTSLTLTEACIRFQVSRSSQQN